MINGDHPAPLIHTDDVSKKMIPVRRDESLRGDAAIPSERSLSPRSVGRSCVRRIFHLEPVIETCEGLFTEFKVSFEQQVPLRRRRHLPLGAD